MSEDESDGLNFDEDENSPKFKPQASIEQDDKPEFLSQPSDSESNQNIKSNNQKVNKQQKSASKANKFSDDDDAELSDIFDSDDDDDSNKKPQKQKQIHKDKQNDVKKIQERKTMQQVRERHDNSGEKKRSTMQQRNQNSATKKQQKTSSNNSNYQSNKKSEGPSSAPQNVVIDKVTNQRVTEQQKTIQSGYEKKEALTVLTRSVLETAELRNFHNWIKSVIIKKYSDDMKQIIKKKEDLRTETGQLFVMEIACGQGGDLKKWLHADIGLYVGVDISFNSLKEASRRTKDIMEKLPPHWNYKKFKYGFYQKDGSASTDEFWKHIHDKDKDQDKSKRFFFDIVSCQMAMHYMFGSEQHARNFFSNATQRLNDQGYLLVTCSDSNAIVKKMRSRGKLDSTNNKYTFGNKYFSMAFENLNFPVGKPYGLKYEFYLQDAVGEKDEATGQIKYTPEYLVELNNLNKLAMEYSLVVKENLNFIEFYKNYRNKYGYLFKSMGLDKFTNDHPSIDPELWEISHCYRVIVFQKVDLANRDNKKYQFIRNPNIKQLAQDPIPINYVPSAPEKRPFKH
ncbi:mRNA capping enzyme, large subunit family protein (macronuclear) [Tetrahymena thermophila SB210]|uniref:mRNA (guanine-N(7))-methyltransferase n=1 Tax=Tetrahymena thermophila (strain SB210) TaxID=312017 RepID=Q231D4_TETTS|nr:mRNA capping enzyme, large subunit family protein [Tetrahymena thermophila SB210]EAR91105.3 mRNA capping enzyme, large subunit family protein [Tetrahymena thermophila SB210]|eukprot:XP_001011350.3 mRNA capping enzyme, large subunit family protein [Tetrahymena thermophila SB210]